MGLATAASSRTPTEPTNTLSTRTRKNSRVNNRPCVQANEPERANKGTKGTKERTSFNTNTTAPPPSIPHTRTSVELIHFVVPRPPSCVPIERYITYTHHRPCISMLCYHRRGYTSTHHTFPHGMNTPTQYRCPSKYLDSTCPHMSIVSLHTTVRQRTNNLITFSRPRATLLSPCLPPIDTNTPWRVY